MNYIQLPNIHENVDTIRVGAKQTSEAILKTWSRVKDSQFAADVVSLLTDDRAQRFYSFLLVVVLYTAAFLFYYLPVSLYRAGKYFATTDQGRALLAKIDVYGRLVRLKATLLRLSVRNRRNLLMISPVSIEK